MSVCIYVCVFMYICVFVCVSMCICMYVCVLCMHVFVCLCVCGVCMYVLKNPPLLGILGSYTHRYWEFSFSGNFYWERKKNTIW